MFISSLQRYPSYLVVLAVTAALVLAALLFPLWIRLLRVRNVGQQVRADGPQGHLVKQGTPTMGGVLILFVIMIVFVVMGAPTRFTLSALVATLACGLLGFVDDWSKVTHARSLGLRPRAKLLWQTLVAVLFGLVVVNWAQLPTWIAIPGTAIRMSTEDFTSTFHMGSFVLIVPWLYLGLVSFMMIAETNAVNLTDGLDGLAAGTVAIVALVYAGIGFRENQLSTALLSASIAGACIGFLWYNSYPADIFMGDTGSLGLGAAIAALAVITKTELLLVLIGGIYVAETLSVVLQVASFKLTGKRIFRMAPLHHHFEMKGWSETKVMVRFWIITGIMAGLGFAIFFVQSVRRIR
jgi:phospho-N-acetylmuramoyl-pentapeptide-transferase